jgi:4-diphosphocytidyl-2-C-methyl-D-erythritol kinase
MVFFPNCKINLGLRILRKRGDGFHDLETVFYPLPLKDVLEIVPIAPTAPGESPDPSAPRPHSSSPGSNPSSPDDPGDSPAPARPHISAPGTMHKDAASEAIPPLPRFSAYGLPIPGDPASNLCLKAWSLLKKDFPDLPPVDIFLYKKIPTGAGLGGGSADGAAMLQGLDAFCHLKLERQELLQYAARLGSDCPFFILNEPCLGSGRGEILEPLKLDLSRYSFVLVHPGTAVSTARAFSQITPAIPARPLKEIVLQPVDTWKGQLLNDFEAPFLHQYPELAGIKEKLYVNGALYASLTGSGSSFFGIFEKEKIPSFNFEQPFQIDTLS